MERIHTPPRRSADGKSTHFTVQRACNGCGRELGDVTREEIDAAIEGRTIDVRDECGCAPS